MATPEIKKNQGDQYINKGYVPIKKLSKKGKGYKKIKTEKESNKKTKISSTY